MSDYVRAEATWFDDAAGGTPITAAKLNTIEAGIDTAHDEHVKLVDETVKAKEAEILEV